MPTNSGLNPVKQTLDALNKQFQTNMNELIENHAKSTQKILVEFAKRGVNIND